MSYTPTNWKNGEDPPINAANLNKIENGIVDNVSDIEELKGDMKFKGEVSVLPDSPKPGEVYQATIANLVSQNKVGDLLVFTNNNSWHVIPSGDEADGTVKYIEAGPGISINGPSGSMTVSGTISLDNTYTADGTHNGLMTSAQFTKVANLAAISESGSWNDLDSETIPKSAKRPIYNDLTENDDDAVVSQSGLKTLFDGKADYQHNHLIEEIKDSLGDTGEEHDLYYYLASTSDGVEDNIPVKAAAESHSHGNITSSGYLLNEQGAIATNRWLRTDGSGNITSQENIPSATIRGYTLRDNNGNNAIDLSELNALASNLSSRIQQVETEIGDTSTEDSMAKDIQTLKSTLSSLNSTVGQLGGWVSDLRAQMQDVRYARLPRVENLTSFYQDARSANITIAKNTSDDGYFNIKKNGYWPVALYGFDINNSKTGGGVGNCVPMAMRISGDNGYWQIKNNNNSTAYIQVVLYILYCKYPT